MKHTIITGRLSCHRDGYGFVLPDDGGDDVFIPARYLRDNIHGDLVAVSVAAGRKGHKREGRIVETLERACRTLVGRFETSGRIALLIPDEQRITCDIIVQPGSTGTARHGDVVVAELAEYPSGGRPAQARVVEVLGRPDDPEVEFLTIVRKYNLPHEFPGDVRAEAQAAQKAVSEKDLEARVDLREMTTVTIDGETARDFDDAVAVRREEGNSIRLWVSIADVSHYVAKNTSLDREALNRGTSVYFPGRCIPMLPEELSNGICSLNPREERLTMTVEVLFDDDANAKDTYFYGSVIRSDERLTYTEVREILVDGNRETIARYSHLVEDLKTMKDLALRLSAKRRRRGSIDFDLPEPEIVLDLQGRIESIGRAERNLAHRIIEEFMLAANEAVAEYLERRDLPCLYRVHEPPDPVKLRDFLEFIKPLGLVFALRKDSVHPGDLQHLLDDVAGRPEEKLVNEVLLRCMQQARYSAENLGHFGLASASYLHFTSPIRRYPDLVVHRTLKQALAGNLKKRDWKAIDSELPETAEQSNRRERTALEAEREIVDLKRIQYMEKHLGDAFDGCITGVAAFGFFVELADLLVEGLVHVTTLGDDYYRLLEKQHALVGERSGRQFRVGDRVRVRIDAVSRARRRIEFSLVERTRTRGRSVKKDAAATRTRQSATGKRSGTGKALRPGKGGKRR